MSDHPSGGDPARSLAVLWRTQERASRKGKPDLSVDRIARVGIELADAGGLAALSMRRVADELGVGTMSLYTYVPGKSELLDVMIDMVAGETPRPEDVSGGWRERLTEVARANWALLNRHPWLLQVGKTRPPLGPMIMDKYEYELRTVDGIGLTDIEMDSVLTLVLGHAEISARRAVDAAQTVEQSGLTDEEWWGASAPLLEQLVDGSRYPVAGRVGTAAGEAYNAASDPQHEFAFGLERVLDGVQALLDSRAATRDETPSDPT